MYFYRLSIEAGTYLKNRTGLKDSLITIENMILKF